MNSIKTLRRGFSVFRTMVDDMPNSVVAKRQKYHMNPVKGDKQITIIIYNCTYV
jgi:hypothetical protein